MLNPLEIERNRELESWYSLNPKQTRDLLKYIGCTLNNSSKKIESAFKKHFKNKSDVCKYFKDNKVVYHYDSWASD